MPTVSPTLSATSVPQLPTIFWYETLNYIHHCFNGGSPVHEGMCSVITIISSYDAAVIINRKDM
jgi:hypothetical protein